MNQEPKSLEDIGDEMGLTKERIRQIEGDAMRKLRIGMDLADVLPRHQWAGVLDRLAGKTVRHWEHVAAVHGLQVRENGPVHNQRGVSRRILDALSRGSMSIHELADQVGLQRIDVARAIWNLKRQGLARCVRRGVYESTGRAA